MADERLGGKFSIDITDLRAGLQEANRLIRASESQFRESAAGMEDWAKSEEGLTARQQTLNKQIDIQKEKIAALVREKNNVIQKMTAEGKSQEEIARAIDGTNKQITSESKALDKLKNELSKTENALDDMSDATEEAGDEAEKASGGFTVMKGALANLVAEGFKKAIDAAKEFATSMITTAAEVKAANSQFSQAFGELEKDATEAIANIAKSTGILETRLQSTGAGIYSFARSSGATSAEAMELMEEALMATADSAAYYDRSLEDSAETLQSFLKGNFANDAALGVSATEFTRNAKAAELFGKEYNDLSEIEKQKTLLKMVTDSQKLSGAFGQAARESDGFENVMGNLSETYKQFQSKVGTPVLEALIPVIQEVTERFQEFQKSVDWNEFGRNATEKLNEFIATAKTLAKNALPVLKSGLEAAGKVIKFVSNNFETLTKVTLAAVVAISSLKTAIAAANAINTLSIAIPKLTANIKSATAIQKAWNASVLSNPYVALGAAVVALTVAVVAYAAKANEALKSTYELTQEQKKAISAAHDAAKAYKEQNEAVTELVRGEVANIEYTRTLWKELQTLTDANGKVKEGYEGRAQFILNELNAALGTEYKMNGDIVQSYQEISDAIDVVIQKKKAQILLEGYEGRYLEAVKKVNSAETERAKLARELANEQAGFEEATVAYQKAQDNLSEALMHGSWAHQQSAQQGMTAAKSEYEARKAALDETKSAYDDANYTVEKYHSDISNYELASGYIMQDETEKAIGYLNKMEEEYQIVGSTAEEVAKEKKKALENDVINTQVNVALMEDEYKRLSGTMTDEEKEQAKTRLKNAKKAADDAIIAFNEVGGNITKGIAEGAEDEENTNWTLTGAMKGLINKAVAAARKAAQEHSPSRLFRNKVGIGLSQGIAVGVSDGTKDVVKAVKKQIGDIEDAYDLSGITSAVDFGINGGANKNGSPAKGGANGGVVVNQYNNYSQAHSRLELYKTKQQTTAAVRLAMGEV